MGRRPNDLDAGRSGPSDSESVAQIIKRGKQIYYIRVFLGRDSEGHKRFHSQRIYDAFQQNKVKTQFIIIEGAGHGFRGDDAKRATAAMVAWFEQTLLKSPPKIEASKTMK